MTPESQMHSHLFRGILGLKKIFKGKQVTQKLIIELQIDPKFMDLLPYGMVVSPSILQPENSKF